MMNDDLGWLVLLSRDHWRATDSFHFRPQNVKWYAYALGSGPPVCLLSGGLGLPPQSQWKRGWLSYFVQIDALDLFRLDAKVLQRLTLGTMVEDNHQFRDASTKGHTLVIPEGLPEGVAAVIALQVY